MKLGISKSSTTHPIDHINMDSNSVAVNLGATASSSSNHAIAEIKESSFMDRNQLPPTVVIVGAGPSGLGTAACLKLKGISYVILEREDCIASLWRHRTYDRLHLHIPKSLCQLPGLNFAESCPTYPSRAEFMEYLEEYARIFDLKPIFRSTVSRAEFSAASDAWVVTVDVRTPESEEVAHTLRYEARWLVVATGENAEPSMPELEGKDVYGGAILHGSEYRSGKMYKNKDVLVVGCGNTGMDIALDLSNFGAKPTIVARSPFHVLPRDLFGLKLSTIQVIGGLAACMPLWLADKCVILLSWLSFGNMKEFGFVRPKEGPLAGKARIGKTPVIDVGTVAKVKDGHIKVVPDIKCLTKDGAKFVNGLEGNFEVIIMATGYVSTVPLWLENDGMFGIDGFPELPRTNGWKTYNRLYAVGFRRKGIKGCAVDAIRVADDIFKDTTPAFYCKCAEIDRVKSNILARSQLCKGKGKDALTLEEF